jgi:hypothetical protein
MLYTIYTEFRRWFGLTAVGGGLVIIAAGCHGQGKRGNGYRHHPGKGFVMLHVHLRFKGCLYLYSPQLDEKTAPITT